MDHILFQTFKIILYILLKKHETIGDNSPIRIYLNKIKNSVVSKIKTGYKLELLSTEKRKLVGGKEKVIAKDKKGKNVAKLNNVDVILMHFNIDNNSYQQPSKVSVSFVLDK